MLRVWGAGAGRPTKDIDLLGRMNNSLEHLTRVFQEVCTIEAEPDGMAYDRESVSATLIKEDAEYHGVRVKLLGTLERARVSIQVDIGFGDRLAPEPEPIDYPTILDLPAPHLRAYRRETVIAEKLHAMVFLGELNSRMKDFYDVWVLATTFDFDGTTLADAIKTTFATRATDIEVDPVALTNEFIDAPTSRANWSAFTRRLQLHGPASDLRGIVQTLRSFLNPILQACAGETRFRKVWNAPGPWQALGS